MENLQNVFFEVTFLAVLAALVVNQVIGMLWYSPNVFGTQWAKHIGMDIEKVDKKADKKGFMLGGLLSLEIAFLMGLLIYNTDSINPLDEALYGLLIAGFITMHQAVGFIYENRSAALFRITAGYTLVTYPLMGLILGSWA